MDPIASFVAKRSKTDSSKPKANSPRAQHPPSEWSDQVWSCFSDKLKANKSSIGKPYLTAIPIGSNPPPALANETCLIPTGAAAITICTEGLQFQRPLHRIKMYLQLREEGKPIPAQEEQASHICMDSVNTDGRGEKHCCNPAHMIIEDDKANKSRQRCAGWIFVLPFQENPGNFWYPTCTHTPPCKRYTSKPPTELVNPK